MHSLSMTWLTELHLLLLLLLRARQNVLLNIAVLFMYPFASLFELRWVITASVKRVL